MAVYKFHYTGQTVDRRPIDPAEPDISYSIMCGLMRLYANNKLVTTMRMRHGQLYGVNCKKGTPYPFRLHAPEADRDVLLWLLGFRQASRVYDINVFHQRCEKLEQAGGKILDDSIGHSWHFCLYSKPDGGTESVAYLNCDSTPDPGLVKDILTSRPWNISFPRGYVERILRERLGLVAGSISRITSNLCFTEY